MVLYLRNTESGLMPLYDSDLFEKKKLRIGEDYKVEVKLPRNIKLHKKYFALIKCVWMNLPEPFDKLYPHPENLRKALQVQAGYYEKYYLIDGTELMEAQSISFDHMDEIKFREVYERVLDVILKHILPHNTKEEIEEEIFNYL